MVLWVQQKLTCGSFSVCWYTDPVVEKSLPAGHHLAIDQHAESVQVNVTVDNFFGVDADVNPPERQVLVDGESVPFSATKDATALMSGSVTIVLPPPLMPWSRNMTSEISVIVCGKESVTYRFLWTVTTGMCPIILIACCCTLCIPPPPRCHPVLSKRANALKRSNDKNNCWLVQRVFHWVTCFLSFFFFSFLS